MLGGVTSKAFKAFNDRWTEQLQEAKNVFADERSAHLIRVFLDELHGMRVAELAVELTVARAAAVSGYHPSSIWRLVDDGDLGTVDDAEDTRIVATALPLKMNTEQAETSDSDEPCAAPEDTTDHPLGAAELELIED